MAPIPVAILHKLTGITLSGYEWKVMLHIIYRTIGKDKPSAAITLAQFEGATGIKKAHVCRTLTMLEERKIVSRLSFGNTSVYSFNQNNAHWVMGTLHPKPEIDRAFDKWFAKYPVPFHKEEAREAYFYVISENLATPEDLDRGLAGYLKLTKARSHAFGTETNPLYFMLAQNFLRDKKYEEYANLTELTTELQGGSQQSSVETGGKRVTKRTEKEERYWREREELRTKLLDEQADEIMDAEENDDMKILQAIKAEIDAELVKFSRQFWAEDLPTPPAEGGQDEG